MRSQRSINRKKAKARARFKSYTRIKNINANPPSDIRIEKVPKYSQVKLVSGQTIRTSDGRPKLAHEGYKDKTVKTPHFNNHMPNDPSDPKRDKHKRRIGMAAYPLRRKFHEKKQRNLIKQ